jgi:hypothetical protein
LARVVDNNVPDNLRAQASASVAHPNDELLPEAEAMLVVNCARTILSYLDTKVSTRI